jgi:hypothetical protein
MHRRQCGKARRPRLGSWPLFQPGDNPIDIDRSGSCYVLYGRFVQATVARAPQAKGPPPLGQGAFDPRSALLGLLALVTAIPGPGRLECLVLGLGWQSETAALLA